MKLWNGKRKALLVLLGSAALAGAMELEGLGGSLLLDGRVRYEGASQTGLEDAHALTGRLRLGYESERLGGLNFLVEGEGTVPLESGSYDGWPGAQGTPGKTVIADSENLELNRLQVDWRNEEIGVTVGRQRIIRNNARFIGNVGWRQNEQTFDAAAVSWQVAGEWKLYYAYLDQAMRIFGDRAEVESQRRFTMESHVLEAQWSPWKGVQTGAYAYLLGIENAPANSSDTAGIWIDGQSPTSGNSTLSFLWRGELARQVENSHSPEDADFALTYIHLLAGLKKDGLGSLSLGFESLGGDGRLGFSTPLATLHAFNGFADLFLSTPADGLQDYYLKASAPIGRALTATAILHYFRADNLSTRYGTEADFVLSWKIDPHLSVTGKVALYDGADGAPGAAAANVSKFWLQLDAKY